MTFFAFVLATLVGFTPDVPVPTPALESPVSCIENAPREQCALTARALQGAVQVDGRLDEADWQRAAVATGFKQFEPTEGGEPTFPTEVRVLYGADALYVGALLHDDNPGQIQKTLGRRDDFNQADWFMVSIDSYFDRKTAYAFAINAAGVQVDGIVRDGGGFRGGDNIDTSWDAIWNASVATSGDGWVVEMRIPYSMLRFSEAERQTWGINFRRHIPRLSEVNEWALVRREDQGSGIVAQYGVLRGMENIKAKRNVQVTPYTVSSFKVEEGTDGGAMHRRELDVGGDLKLSISSNVTLDATFNPDFGQVESDPAQLNLSAFETFFPERRPFFVEGVQIFEYNLGSFRDGGLLYTRRIGAGEPIRGAAKLSGRMDNGFSFGVLTAATEKFYGVTRLRQEFGRNSYLGSIVTFFDNTVFGATNASGLRTLAGGVDWDIRLADNTYGISGQLNVTDRRFTGAGEEDERGLAFALGLDKLSGIWTYYASVVGYGDTFNPNDVGRLQQRNLVRTRAGFSHQINGGDAFGPFRRASVRLFTWHDWAYADGTYQGSNAWFFTNWTTRGFQRFSINIENRRIMGGYDVYETRGLGSYAAPYEGGVRFEFSTDSRRDWELEPGFELSADEYGGRELGIGLGARWNASPRLSLGSRIRVGGQNDRVAWSANESFKRGADGWLIGLESGYAPDELPAGDYRAFDGAEGLDVILPAMAAYDETGAYYVPVFGRRDTRSVDLSLRGNVTFSPALSLQLYSQLFVASGQYDTFQILQDADTRVDFDAYPKTRDFQFGSFLSNVVLRWEYRPGSALFVVWSQNRSNSSDLDPFDLGAHSPFDVATGRQLADVFDVFPTNVFLVKLNYTFLR